MAATRISCLELARSSLKSQNPFAVRHSFAGLNRNDHNPESGYNKSPFITSFPSNSAGHGSQFGYGNGIMSLGPKIGALYGGIGHVMCVRTYSSSPDGTIPSSGDGGVPWMDKVKDVWNSTVDAVVYTGEKAKEASREVTPHVKKVLDTYLDLNDVVVPFVGNLIASSMAWCVMKLFSEMHAYSEQAAARLYGSSFWGAVPYERSFWGALEDPVRYLFTFMAFVHIGIMVAPTSIAAQYIGRVWKGAFIVSLMWFLNRCKTRALENSVGFKRNNLMITDKVTLVSLFVFASMGLAETCGVPSQTILTIGGVGGVATAFAAKDILGNILSGLSLQILQPFVAGDTVTSGSVEGQVLNVGLTTTLLRTAEKFLAEVPNSLFSSQVIVNKSRTQWRSMATTIPLQTDDLDKIPLISEDIKKMLKENADVFLEKEAPYCFLSRIERSCAELTIGCNLKFGCKGQHFKAQENILLKSVDIIKLHGATLGSFS